MNKIFNVELIEFEKLFKKKLISFFNGKKNTEDFNSKDETLKKINDTSWFSTEPMKVLKGKIDESELLFSIGDFLIFFNNHFLFYMKEKRDVFKDEFYNYIGSTNFLKIPYENLFYYSKSIFKDWGRDKSLGPHSLKTFSDIYSFVIPDNDTLPLKKDTSGPSITLQKGGYYPFKYIYNSNTTSTTYEKWGTTTIKCGLRFDRFNSHTQNYNCIEFNNLIYLKGSDLSNFIKYSYVFKWFEKSINEINSELCQTILNKLDKEGQIKTKKLNIKKESVFSEIDKDGNGLVDVIEGFDEIDLLLKKHQKEIISIDSKHVMEFVQVSNYLKLKKKNIQKIFEELKKVSDEKNLKIYLEVLKDNIHVYDLITLNSLLMINSLINMDMITFSNIYLKFDSLNIFDLKHEKDVSNKLDNLEKGLNQLMGTIRKVGDEICDEIYSLATVTEESNRQLTNQLKEIDSTMKVGNLINTINTYQNYKTNRRLNS